MGSTVAIDLYICAGHNLSPLIMCKKKPRIGFIGFFLIASLYLYPDLSISQQVENVPSAFKALSSEPEVIILNNEIEVPRDKGHLQGVQLIEINGSQKLLISGSSLMTAYILQADLKTLKTDKLIPLMKAPYRHAGGIQASEPYLSVGIEDNFSKAFSKVCLYNYRDANLHKASPNITIVREGKVKRQTAGATGLLKQKNDYLLVVGNWDSRNWDFYSVNPEKDKKNMLASFSAPKEWESYQAINLIKDDEAIYAIGFYKKELACKADLIRITELGAFELIMEKVLIKTFNCTNGVDFGSAAGLEVDQEGNLHIWGTQKDALKQIAVNKFSQH